MKSAAYQIDAKKKMFVCKCLPTNLRLKDTATKVCVCRHKQISQENIENHNDQLSQVRTRHHWHPLLVRSGAFFFKIYRNEKFVKRSYLWLIGNARLLEPVSDFPIFSFYFKTNFTMEISQSNDLIAYL